MASIQVNYIHGRKKLTSKGIKYMKFMAKCWYDNVDKKTIIEYWMKNAAAKEHLTEWYRDDGDVWYKSRPYEWNNDCVEKRAMIWFDRWMGKFFRLNNKDRLSFLNSGNVSDHQP